MRDRVGVGLHVVGGFVAPLMMAALILLTGRTWQWAHVVAWLTVVVWALAAWRWRSVALRNRPREWTAQVDVRLPAGRVDEREVANRIADALREGPPQ